MDPEGRRGQGSGRTKKLLEVARWKYTGVFDAKTKRLIAGATFCETRCRPRLRELAALSGLKFEDGTCFHNKAAGPGGCKATYDERLKLTFGGPCPEISPGNFKVWELWEQTWDAGNFRGMDGDPVGRHFCCVESAARALGVPWNRRTFTKFRVVLAVWLESMYERIKERDAGRKKKK